MAVAGSREQTLTQVGPPSLHVVGQKAVFQGNLPAHRGLHEAWLLRLRID